MTRRLSLPSSLALAPAAAQPSPSTTEAADLAACRHLLHQGSLTFFAASLLLPRKVREPASALYAFCRLADDAVDNGDNAPDAIDQLRQRLSRAYAGRPGPHAADRALAAVVRTCDIPRTLPEALLEGFEWDAAGRRYDSLADLEHYAARVAGAVGAMMALLMGVRSEDALARACDLGVAMQLSNIARDVGEDARMGRLYLPRDWMREAGLDPDAWLAEPVFSPALAAVVTRLLAAADQLYDRVGAGVAQLPADCQPGINAARFLYAEIGHEVARRGGDSVTQRAVVPGRRKALLLLRALLNRPARAVASVDALEATRYLVDAARCSNPPSSADGHDRPWWRPVARAAWTIDLFERVELRRLAERERDQALRHAGLRSTR
jgi:phytoene synthase